MTEDRKKVVLSIQEKLELIKKIENGASKKQVNLQYIYNALLYWLNPHTLN